MKVLVACEESQRVCKAFREKGHEAYSCDIQECSGGHPEWHIKENVLYLLNGDCGFYTCDNEEHFISGNWDLIIAHPPCTYMSKAGARWMFPKAGEIDWGRYALAMEAKDFFMAFYNCECEKIVIENPVPLKCVELPEPTQKIQPYEFDDKNERPYSKATLLWIKGVPKLRPTTPRNKPIGTWMPSNTGGFSRGKGGGRGIAHDKKTASKTFSGIARAMAEQWG
ncbi:DNA cytosine methyltransferase [Ruminococcus sp.]|uniref:DNA cytosine methyltransferase n=1 Tax=Ruminococcus sp. TaxID=41978 RepID=UPI00262DBB71|nr:DNA cytosine methyltransferase [Ruminococcus sp.]MDD6990171.1 DNA cytosine methyltransferase [Ruminococcus sp.]MDY6202881.1 DNA cytosine methyltransferase [Ruminococcus sp.]